MSSRRAALGQSKRVGLTRAGEDAQEGESQFPESMQPGWLQEAWFPRLLKAGMLWGKARPSRSLDLASFLVLPPESPAVPGNTATLWDSGLEQGGLQTMARD